MGINLVGKGWHNFLKGGGHYFKYPPSKLALELWSTWTQYSHSSLFCFICHFAAKWPKDCTTEHLKTQTFSRALKRARTHDVKVSHSRAHSLADLPPKICVIDQHLNMLLTKKILLLPTFYRCSVPFCKPLIGLRLHHRAYRMQNFPEPVKGFAFRFTVGSILNTHQGWTAIWAL